MDDLYWGIIGFVAVLSLMALGVHVGLALAATGFIGMFLMTGKISLALALFTTTPYSTTNVYAFAILPLFIIMGLFAMHAGLSARAFDAAYKWVGRLPGGMAIATTWANAMFTACTGSSVVACAVFTRISLPEMDRRGYDAELRIELEESTPPGCSSGGVVRLQVKLLPLEPFQIRSGRLELALLTTRFSRTALDGYHEHTAENVLQTTVLCESAAAYPGKVLMYSTGLLLPHKPPIPPDSRPTRQQWQVRARFESDGYRELQATRFLLDASPQQGGAPVVDGSGFLPLYEFRTDTNP